ncbi:Cro/CI family transcriptional regulator [Providencia rettgeri]|uniref:Cro/CI family transcriptional regulator n=1 Tax=Providencia TaxID=586 RepID=UPI001B38D636|nr:MULTISPECIES: Cro/CI family transcriptional regulator [Providencia]EJD6367372.1 cell division protein [Providencia rettgeri]EJD6371601.1 cell division protein [Providencia rettgeri]EKH6496537.1 cell division protein [Providencia rettgeri]ELR5161049.1 cell division protein [Providencia rettgeri]ELR5250170.1 cell division protein [Providencia rettgeri]
MTTEQIEKYFGTTNKIAEFFRISPEAFYQWKKRPNQLIPKNRAMEADYRTKGELRFNPELYQNSTKTN